MSGLTAGLGGPPGTMNEQRHPPGAENSGVLEKSLRWTKFGLLIVFLAILLIWLPRIRYFGIALEFVGILFMLAGRTAFGRRHTRNLEIAIVLLAVSVTVDNLSNLLYPVAILSITANRTVVSDITLYDTVIIFLVANVMAAIMSGLAVIFAMYELVDARGFNLLLLALILQLVVTVAVSYYLWTGIIYSIEAAQCACPGLAPTPLGPILSYVVKKEALVPLNVIFLSVYALAIFVIWSDLKRRSSTGPNGIPQITVDAEDRSRIVSFFRNLWVGHTLEEFSPQLYGWKQRYQRVTHGHDKGISAVEASEFREDGRYIERNNIGITILIIAMLILWLPYIQYLGYVLVFEGLFLIAAGAKPFGEKHFSNTAIAFALFSAGSLTLLLGATSFTGVVTSIPTADGYIGEFAVYNTVLGYLVVTVLGSALVGLAFVYAFYGIESKRGRRSLWLAFGLQIATSVVVAIFLWFQAASAMGQVFGANTILQPLLSLVSKWSLLSLFNVAYLVAFAYAFNIARHEGVLSEFSDVL